MNVRISILPKSSLGRWSVGLGVAWILFFALSEVLTGFEVLGPGFNPALAVALTIVLAGISGAAFVTGLISMLKSKEQSVFVSLTTAIGLYGLIGTTGSLLGLAK
jgi:hypothetical protein